MLKISNHSIVYKISPGRLLTGSLVLAAGIGCVLWSFNGFQGATFSWGFIFLGLVVAYLGWGQISVSKDYHCLHCNKLLNFSELYFPLGSEQRLLKFLESHHKDFSKDLFGAEDVMIIDQDQEDYLDLHFCYCPKCRKVGHVLNFWRVKNKKKEIILENKPLSGGLH